LVAQAVAATTCSNNESARAEALGRMTTAYTIGAAIGPSLGGFLADLGGMYLAAKLAVVGSLLSMFLSILYLPERNISSKHKKIGKGQQRSHCSVYDEIRLTFSVALRGKLLPLLVVKVCGGVAASIYQTTLPIVLTQDLKFEPTSLGILMSCSMLATAIFGAVVVGPLMNTIRAAGMTYNGLIFRACLGCLMAYSISVTVDDTTIIWTSLRHQLVGISILHAMATHSIATGLTTQTTGAVDSNEQGVLLGLEHGLFSIARVFGPPVGINLLLFYDFVSVASLCGVIDILLVILLMCSSRQAASSAERKSVNITCNENTKISEKGEQRKLDSCIVNHDQKSR
jgi:predicted MFS family arabinose efflux permease